MSISLTIRFTNGQYHATPWGNHVNEGLVEWPPSPWRLIRAFIAVGFAKHNWGNDINTIPETARSLLNKLTACLPSYKLPQGAVAHTRHYMPLYDSTKRDCAKILDPFLRIANTGISNDECLIIYWPVDLNTDEQSCLRALLQSMSYLGRRESWIEASLDDDTAEPDDDWCTPANADDLAKLGCEQISLYAPVDNNCYADWLSSQPKPTKKSKGLQLPEDILGCLCLSTVQWRDIGWSQPPGSKKVFYWRKLDAMEPAAPQVSFVKPSLEPVDCILLALTSDTVRGTVRPLLSRVLPQMEILHQTAVGILARQTAGIIDDISCITGKDVDGNPLKGAHLHAHYYPLDLDGDKRIDHVLIYAPMQMNDSTQRAFMSISRTYAKNIPNIIVTTVGTGSLEMMCSQIKDRWGKTPSVIGKSKVWESYTPFIAPRYLHKSGKHSIEDQILQECISRNLPEPAQIIIQRNTHFLDFVCKRRNLNNQPSSTIPFCIRLEFETEVSGPISLGYASHYGLGVFKAMDN